MRFLKTRQADAKSAKAKVDLLGLKNNVFKDIKGCVHIPGNKLASYL